jgi:PleD family two-component response regulator
MKRLANRPPEAQPAGPEKIRSARGCMRVLIVDDEALARQGIRMLLDQDADISLIEGGQQRKAGG